MTASLLRAREMDYLEGNEGVKIKRGCTYGPKSLSQMAVVGGKRILIVCMKSGRSNTLKPDKFGLSYKANICYKANIYAGIRDLGVRLWMLIMEWHGF